MKEETKIEIRPIPNLNGITDFAENLEFFSQAHIIAPFVNPVTRRYATGLTKEDVKALEEKQFPYDLSDVYIKGKAHDFWENSIIKVELTNSPIFLYPGKNDIDFVKYKYLMVSDFIYSSEAQMKNGGKPEATHYIYDEGETNKIKATAIEIKNNLVKKVSNLSPARKREIILIILNENTDNKDEDYLTVRFEDIISNKDKNIELISLLEEDSEKISLKADIKSAIQKNVLKRTKNGIYFFETNLGFSEADVAKALSDLDNQEVYLNIKSKIQ